MACCKAMVMGEVLYLSFILSVFEAFLKANFPNRFHPLLGFDLIASKEGREY